MQIRRAHTARIGRFRLDEVRRADAHDVVFDFTAAAFTRRRGDTSVAAQTQAQTALRTGGGRHRHREAQRDGLRGRRRRHREWRGDFFTCGRGSEAEHRIVEDAVVVVISPQAQRGIRASVVEQTDVQSDDLALGDGRGNGHRVLIGTIGRRGGIWSHAGLRIHGRAEAQRAGDHAFRRGGGRAGGIRGVRPVTKVKRGRNHRKVGREIVVRVKRIVLRAEEARFAARIRRFGAQCERDRRGDDAQRRRRDGIDAAVRAAGDAVVILLVVCGRTVVEGRVTEERLAAGEFRRRNAQEVGACGDAGEEITARGIRGGRGDDGQTAVRRVANELEAARPGSEGARSGIDLKHIKAGEGPVGDLDGVRARGEAAAAETVCHGMLGVIHDHIRAIDAQAAAIIGAHAKGPGAGARNRDHAGGTHEEIREATHREGAVSGAEAAIRAGGVVVQRLRDHRLTVRSVRGGELRVRGGISAHHRRSRVHLRDLEARLRDRRAVGGRRRDHGAAAVVDELHLHATDAGVRTIVAAVRIRIDEHEVSKARAGGGAEAEVDREVGVVVVCVVAGFVETELAVRIGGLRIRGQREDSRADTARGRTDDIETILIEMIIAGADAWE